MLSFSNYVQYRVPLFSHHFLLVRIRNPKHYSKTVQQHCQRQRQRKRQCKLWKINKTIIVRHVKETQVLRAITYRL